MPRPSHFGLSPAIADLVLPLAAHVIEQAHSLGRQHWGLTFYDPGFRINVGFTEIFTICDDHLRLIVDGKLAFKEKLPRSVKLEKHREGRPPPYYATAGSESVLAKILFRQPRELAQGVEALRPALKEAVRAAGRWPAGRTLRVAHNQRAVEQLGAAVGRKLPDPDFAGPAVDYRDVISRASHFQAGGESEDHRRLKEYVAGNPRLLGLPANTSGKTEYSLPSGDSVDVHFQAKCECVAAEVKAKRSLEADILRGIFQCIKYRAVMEACQVLKGVPQGARAVLVLEGALPDRLVPLRSKFDVEVHEHVVPK